jgi:serine/threonine-protein kinase
MTSIPEPLAAALEATYRLEGELGRGGMATVYLASDLKHGRQVAVKVLHPELAAAIGGERFTREIEIAAKLTHPHILMLIDSGEADGYLYYVMPLVEGESLGDRLKREGRIPVAESIRIMDQVASALSHAHERGVIHRDVKPANILLSGDQAIVADFGIARAVEAAGGSGLTGTGMAVGTPAYMSPEQAFDHGTVDGRSDVYAMGCVLFEMIAGRPPYESTSAMALLAKHAAERPPSLRQVNGDVPLFVDRAVSRALAKSPADRFDSPRDFVRTLRSEAVVAPVGRRRIAVLPPVNIGADADQQYLVLGLHEALISQIGAGDLAVLARTSVLQYQDGDRPARDVCRELAVEAVVESSIFCVGESLGVQARLVDGETEESRWSGSYDGTLGEVLSMYRTATKSIADGIHDALGLRSRDGADRPSVDPVAYEKYMRGRVNQQSFNPTDIDRAIDYFQAALDIQPDYAPAQAGIALTWGSKIVLGIVPSDEAGPAWLEAARRAAELDPALAEAHQALAQAHTWYNWDWEAAAGHRAGSQRAAVAHLLLPLPGHAAPRPGERRTDRPGHGDRPLQPLHADAAGDPEGAHGEAPRGHRPARGGSPQPPPLLRAVLAASGPGGRRRGPAALPGVLHAPRGRGHGHRAHGRRRRPPGGHGAGRRAPRGAVPDDVCEAQQHAAPLLLGWGYRSGRGVDGALVRHAGPRARVHELPGHQPQASGGSAVPGGDHQARAAVAGGGSLCRTTRGSYPTSRRIKSRTSRG